LARHVSGVVERDYEIFAEIFYEKTPFEGNAPRRLKLKMEIWEKGCESMDWAQLPEDKIW
jgi:hypothetical protein